MPILSTIFFLLLCLFSCLSHLPIPFPIFYLFSHSFHYPLKGAVDVPVQPLAAIIGGAKVSTKVPVIESLLSKCQHVFVGGGMIFTFYKAMGYKVKSPLSFLRRLASFDALRDICID